MKWKIIETADIIEHVIVISLYRWMQVIFCNCIRMCIHASVFICVNKGLCNYVWCRRSHMPMEERGHSQVSFCLVNFGRFVLFFSSKVIVKMKVIQWKSFNEMSFRMQDATIGFTDILMMELGSSCRVANSTPTEASPYPAHKFFPQRIPQDSIVVVTCI